MSDYGLWQGAERATGNMAATGMGLLQMQNTERHQKALEADSAARLKIAEDQAKIQNAQQNIALEEAQKKQAADNRVVDLTTHPAFLSLPEAQRPEVLKFFSNNGMTDATGRGTARGLREGAQMIESSVPLFQKFMGPVVQAKQAEVLNAWSEFQQAQATGDPKKVEAARVRFDQLNGQYHQSLGKFDEHLKNLTDQEQAKKLKQMEIDAAKEKLTGANQTEEQLTARALKGDKEAQSILAAMDQRKVDRERRVSALVEDRAQNRLNISQDKSDRTFAVSLRKEFNNLPEVKEANQVVPKIKSMQAAFEESKKTKNFVAVDQALITLYNKLTDPTSVVRESEYARTAQNIPLINAIKGKFQKVLEGGAGLTSAERSALMDMANLMQKGYADIRGRRMGEYRGYGVQAGLKEDFLVDSMTGAVAPAAAVPTVGTIKQGYKFKGGNPADRNSWEKL